MKTKITILILLLLLTSVHAQEESINCEDISYCIELVEGEEINCINKIDIGWGDECIEFEKSKAESTDGFDKHIKLVKQCRELISKEKCELNTKECDDLAKQANSIFGYESVGKCYTKFGQCKKAEEPYKKAIEMYENEEENYLAIANIYARLASCYNLKDNANKEKEYYKNAGYNYKKEGDELLKFYREYPRVFDNDYKRVANASAREYLSSARAYKAAEDYENACKSCQEANKYYREINKPTLECKKYRCNRTKPSETLNENSKQPDHNIILTIVIILITIILSLIVIWYGKFKLKYIMNITKNHYVKSRDKWKMEMKKISEWVYYTYPIPQT